MEELLQWIYFNRDGVLSALVSKKKESIIVKSEKLFPLGAVLDVPLVASPLQLGVFDLPDYFKRKMPHTSCEVKMLLQKDDQTNQNLFGQESCGLKVTNILWEYLKGISEAVSALGVYCNHTAVEESSVCMSLSLPPQTIGDTHRQLLLLRSTAEITAYDRGISLKNCTAVFDNKAATLLNAGLASRLSEIYL